MRFSTIFATLAASVMAFATPIPDDTKDSTNDMLPFSILSAKCDIIFPKFDNCSDDICSAAIVYELTIAIDDCTTAVGGLIGGSGTPDFATGVADVVKKITNNLDTHKDKCGDKCPYLIGTYARVDQSLSGCLDKFFSLYTNMADAVSKLLSDFASTLKGLKFTSVLKVCGLA